MENKIFSKEELDEYLEQLRIVVDRASAEISELEKQTEANTDEIIAGVKETADKLMQNVNTFQDNVIDIEKECEKESESFFEKVKNFLIDNTYGIEYAAGGAVVGAIITYFLMR